MVFSGDFSRGVMSKVVLSGLLREREREREPKDPSRTVKTVRRSYRAVSRPEPGRELGLKGSRTGLGEGVWRGSGPEVRLGLPCSS